MLNVTKATTAELIAFYNENSEKPVKRFADRKSAERRVNALIESLPVEDKAAPVNSEARSVGVALSWTKPEVAAKRAQRSAVKVDGHQYSSVAAAYRALGLPMNDCIAVRMLLKEKGSMQIEGVTWEIVPLNY